MVRSFASLRTGNTSNQAEGLFTTEPVEVSCFANAKRLLTTNGIYKLFALFMRAAFI
jgi:hypothetical protein